MDHHHGQLNHHQDNLWQWAYVFNATYRVITWPGPPPRLIPPIDNCTTITTTTQCSLDRLMSTSKDRRDRLTSSGNTGIHTSSWLGERLVPECCRNSGHLTTAAAAHLPPTLPRVGIFIYKLWTTLDQELAAYDWELVGQTKIRCTCMAVQGGQMGCLSCSDVEHQWTLHLVMSLF